MRPIKYCTSRKKCNARIKQQGYSLCCRYGWCGWAQPSQDRGRRAISKEREIESLI